METGPSCSPDQGSCGCPCRSRAWLLALGVLLIVFAVLHFLPRKIAPEGEAPSVTPRTYDGPSSLLQKTVVVPTADTPMPAGKNVIWCGSFQMAWNRLRDDVIKEPLRVSGAEDVARGLNAAPLREADLPAGSFYAAAGQVDDGIVETIRSEMAERFPGTAVPDFGSLAKGDLLAYAFLRTSAKFTVPYSDHEGGWTFTDSAGAKTPIRTFGFNNEPRYDSNDEGRAEQVRVLYAQAAEKEADGLKAFAADLCETSRPNQLILAVVEPKATLAATWMDLKSRMGSWDAGQFLPFDESCKLEVPTLNWRITHQFAELTGEEKTFQNASFESYFIRKALQMIEFSLDKGGAKLTSEAELAAAAADKDSVPSIHLVFDRPFLIVLRQRGREEPFFLMWVDNAELLGKAAAAGSP